MRDLIKSTALLGSTSVVSLAVGLAASKLWASMLGPTGYGHMGLLQSMIGLAGLFVELGLGTAIVQEGTRLAKEQDRSAANIVFRSAASVSWISTAVAVSVLVCFRTTVAGWIFADPGQSSSVVWAAVALALNIAGAFRIAVLTASRAVASLARVTVITTVVGTAGALGLAAVFGLEGLAPGIAFTATVHWLAARQYSQSQGIGWVLPFVKGWRRRAWGLIKTGLPFTASILVGPGVQMSLPILLLPFVGKGGVGLYQAASGMATVFFGFLVPTLGQDYYPRLRAISDDHVATKKLVSQQHVLLLLLVGMIALCAKALLPFAVPLLLAKEFVGLGVILDWHLPGEVLRFSSAVFAYLLLSRVGGVLFFLVSVFNGTALLVGILLLTPWLGVRGAGVAFFLTYAAYWLLIVGICWRRFDVSVSAHETRLLVTILSATCFPNLFNSQMVKSVLEGVFAILFATLSLHTLSREFGWHPARLLRKRD